ncbi:putative lipoprotein YajG [Sphingomonas jejuensis]|uniref:Lipoprotein YajG n=1 Tax=Sphingomonas jejuensis TaxID=904715 RepID=A0ABX0XKG7_9SPHN|nr:hypothetical protein [Sphingomonas jejuensis]NJC33852.1 putative lipoprotein YajG [Sphingomonas jejuensis]
MKLLLLSAALLALAGCETSRTVPPVTHPGGSGEPCLPAQNDQPILVEMPTDAHPCLLP